MSENKNPRRGRYILFEGIDGSGKSTQYEMLVARLDKAGVDVVAVHEPGSTELAEKIRSLVLEQKQAGEAGVALWAETMLFLAARAQLLEEVVRPALARGATVVSDRGFYSTLAYQGAGRGLGVEDVALANSLVCGDLLPDLVVVTDISLEEANFRRANRRGVPVDRMEAAGDRFLKVVREEFLELALNRFPDRSLLVDGSGNRAEVAEFIWKNLKARGLTSPAGRVLA